MFDGETRTPKPDASPCEDRVVDAAVALYDRWQSGDSPDVHAFVAGCGILSPPELVAVLRVDQRARWEIGEPIPAETYFHEYPRLLDDPASALDLIYSELLLREQSGEPARLEEFAARFPSLAEALREQVAVHRVLCEVATSAPSDTLRSVERSKKPREAMTDYEILREIGCGGAGVVYEARQISLNRIVAFKVLTAGAHATPAQIARFHAEAELVARLDHPHIVQIYGAGEHEGCPFLAFELVGGGTLRGRINGTPQPPEWSARLLEILARAVHAAHAAGIVHRDLKPANILFAVGPSANSEGNALAGTGFDLGNPKIADFGLAKAFGDSDANAASPTRTGDILGTPSYMSPEQAAGRTGQVGPATDIYALGAILYELLTGRPPFQGVTALETLQQVALQEPVAPSRLQPRLPRDLEVICIKCLQKSPTQRYASALALAEDLRRFQCDEPIAARPTPRAARFARWCRRNPMLSGLGGLVLVLLMTLAIGSAAAHIRLTQAARERLVEARLAEARTVRFSDLPGRRAKSLSLLSEAAAAGGATSQVRDDAIASMALFDLDDSGRGPSTNGDNWYVDFDSELGRFAHADHAGNVQIIRTADNLVISRIPKSIQQAKLLMSPDGRHVAVRSDYASRVEVWSVEQESARLVLEEDCAAVYGLGAVAFNRDARLIAVGRPDGLVRVWSLSERRVTHEVRLEELPRHLAFHPTRPHLAIALSDHVQVVDYETSRLLVELDSSLGATWVVWHPGGLLLASADGDSGISLWEPDERRLRKKLPGHAIGGVQAAFHPAGDFLFSQAWDGALRVWDCGLGELVFTAKIWTEPSPRFSLDGQFWAGEFESGRYHFRRFDAHPVHRRLTQGTIVRPGDYGYLAVSPRHIAGGRLVAASMDSGIGFWDLASGEALASLPIGKVYSILFDPAGALLTNGVRGLERWPIESSGDTISNLTIGPPQFLSSLSSHANLAASADRRVIAVGGMHHALVWHADRFESPIRLEGHADPRYVAVTRDGARVATGSHNGDAVKIWDSATGQVVQSLPLASSRVEFSPDGAWLLTTAGGLTLWSTEGWSKAWSAAAGGALSAHAFSDDGSLVAVETGAGQIALYETRSGRELTRLSDPDQNRQIAMVFAPDRLALAAVSYDRRRLSVWDLCEIDRRLKNMRLSWDLPPFEESRSEQPAPTTRLKIATRFADPTELLERQLAEMTGRLSESADDLALFVRTGSILCRLNRAPEAVQTLTGAVVRAPLNVECRYQRGIAHNAAGHRAEAIADMEAALDLISPQSPIEARLCNHLAWLYVTGPATFWNPERALQLVRRALRLEPGLATYVNTLGVAHYRRGNPDEAIDAFQRSLRTSEEPGCDLYFLALCYRQLNEPQRARKYYEQAVYWNETHAPALERASRDELAEIRREVETVFVSSLHHAPAPPISPKAQK
jgi:WD40 repeat protein/Tfp pilus assembly protein PilF